MGRSHLLGFGILGALFGGLFYAVGRQAMYAVMDGGVIPAAGAEASLITVGGVMLAFALMAVLSIRFAKHLRIHEM